MTMHLLRGTPGLNTKKPKIKMTKAKIAKYQVQWKKHNKWAKSNRLHDFILSFDDYIDYCHGKYKVQVQAAPRKLYQQPESPHKSSKQYPGSFMIFPSLPRGFCFLFLPKYPNPDEYLLLRNCRLRGRLYFLFLKFLPK